MVYIENTIKSMTVFLFSLSPIILETIRIEEWIEEKAILLQQEKECTNGKIVKLFLFLWNIRNSCFKHQPMNTKKVIEGSKLDEH